MADFVIIDGDQALFLPIFEGALVAVKPGTITGSGPATIGSKPICIEGDESSVSVPGCMYLTPQYLIPGTGTLEIKALDSKQVAEKTTVEGTPVILKGQMFEAVFKVDNPAQMPPPGPGPPTPDSSPDYSGKGMFINSNLKVKAT